MGDLKNALKNKLKKKQQKKNTDNNKNELQRSCHRFEARKKSFEETVYKYQEKEGKKSSVGD